MADLTPAQQMAAAGGYKNYSNQTKQPAVPSGGGRGNGNFWTNLKPQSTPVQNKLATGPVVGPATGNQRVVYLGKMPNGSDYTAPVNDARYMMHTLDNASLKKLYGMADSWYGKGRWDPSWLPKLWENAINVSANAYAYANQRVDPVTAFGMVLRTSGVGAKGSSSGGSGGGGGYGGGGGGGTSTAVATSTALTNATEAETIFDNALSTYLGRKATKQEQSAFLKALNKKEAKNPTVTTQTVTSTGKVTQQQSVSAGGFNPSTFAENYAQKMEGSAEYQAATGIMDSFISALKAQV